MDYPKMNDNYNGNLFDSSNEEQRKELLIAYEESFDEEGLLNHKEVKLMHGKWLKKDQ